MRYCLDCVVPSEALAFWKKYLVNYETLYWPAPSWSISRDTNAGYPENYAFGNSNGVVFVGINIVGGLVHDAAEWSARHQANLLWIDNAYRYYRRTHQILVIFAHGAPMVSASDANQVGFYGPLFLNIQQTYTKMQFVIVHRNLVTQTYGVERNYTGIPNLSVVTTQGSIWPPMKIDIDIRTAPWTIAVNQDTWYNVLVGGRV
jgi:hypothetical protein